MTDEIGFIGIEKIIRADDEALKEAEKGTRFIPVGDSFDEALTPDGYSFITYEPVNGQNVNALIPERIMHLLYNSGEWGYDGASEELEAFNDELKKFESSLMAKSETNVMESVIATQTNEAYKEVLINRLVKSTGGEDYDPDVVENLCLNDKYVRNRIEAIAKLCLGKDAELKKSNLKDIIRHEDRIFKVEKKLSEEEFKKVACEYGSRFKLRDEYKNLRDVSYNISGRGSSTKTEKTRFQFDAIKGDIEKFEQEIEDYRRKKGRDVKPGDGMLLREYINISHLCEDGVRLPIIIPEPEEDSSSRG